MVDGEAGRAVTVVSSPDRRAGLAGVENSLLPPSTARPRPSGAGYRSIGRCASAPTGPGGRPDPRTSTVAGARSWLLTRLGTRWTAGSQPWPPLPCPPAARSRALANPSCSSSWSWWPSPTAGSAQLGWPRPPRRIGRCHPPPSSCVAGAGPRPLGSSAVDEPHASGPPQATRTGQRSEGSGGHNK
jgi:hypothetical protein